MIHACFFCILVGQYFLRAQLAADCTLCVGVSNVLFVIKPDRFFIIFIGKTNRDSTDFVLRLVIDSALDSLLEIVIRRRCNLLFLVDLIVGLSNLGPDAAQSP